jgi:hypothetical protein
MSSTAIKGILIAGFIGLSIIILASCHRKNAPKLETQVKEKSLMDEHLSEEIDHGLHKITLETGEKILIYRGVESCTMIQLK